MIVIPAIDVKDGRCVRLYQGDYQRVTVFSEDPAATARRWEEAGAPLVHVVDLDGAVAGKPVNLAAVRAIVEAVDVPIQLGGGVRTLSDIEEAFSAGVSRVILGTAAIEDQALVREACRRWGEGIAVGIDSRHGVVATHGWQRSTRVRAVDLARQMIELGVHRLICTDILRDGTLTEPNYAALGEIAEAVAVPIIASGGVSAVEHLLRLCEMGMEGAIVGRALYTGDLDYRESVRVLASKASSGA